MLVVEVARRRLIRLAHPLSLSPDLDQVTWGVIAGVDSDLGIGLCLDESDQIAHVIRLRGTALALPDAMLWSIRWNASMERAQPLRAAAISP